MTSQARVIPADAARAALALADGLQGREDSAPFETAVVARTGFSVGALRHPTADLLFFADSESAVQDAIREAIGKLG